MSSTNWKRATCSTLPLLELYDPINPVARGRQSFRISPVVDAIVLGLSCRNMTFPVPTVTKYFVTPIPLAFANVRIHTLHSDLCGTFTSNQAPILRAVCLGGSPSSWWGGASCCEQGREGGLGPPATGCRGEVYLTHNLVYLVLP